MKKKCYVQSRGEGESKRNDGLEVRNKRTKKSKEITKGGEKKTPHYKKGPVKGKKNPLTKSKTIRGGRGNRGGVTVRRRLSDVGW